MRNVYTVKQVNAYIKNMFTQDFMLNRIYIKGEVSNCKYHTSGHLYFSLKDESGTIACVMFAGQRSGLSFRMQEGQQIIVLGSVSVYERDGRYQVYAKEIVLDGAGLLYEKFIMLKKELEEMGMFAPEYKKPIPRFAKKVGVVTAKTGAAIQDIINITHRRNPYVQLILYPTLVQGESAAVNIAAGIDYLDTLGLDVIIVGRGGGSIEDLWAFNTEQVARAVFDCNTPVISAVGHETDYTICDFVSDLRAPTPSAAAELAVPDSNVLIDFLDNANKRLSSLLNDRIEREYQKLDYLMLSSFMAEPGEYFSQKFDEVDVLYARLKDGFSYLVEKENSKFSNLVSSLDALSPLKVLARGYSITTKNEKVIRDIEDKRIPFCIGLSPQYNMFINPYPFLIY